jgi:long-chain acyl-CoA synthetase
MNPEVPTPWFQNYEDGVPQSLLYPPVTLPDFLKEAAFSHPQNSALIYQGRKISYRELHRQVQALSNALLTLGVQKGDRVALLLPNCPAYVIGYYATLRIGGVVVSLSPLAVERELAALLPAADARVILVAEDLFPRIASIADGCGVQNVVISPGKFEEKAGRETSRRIGTSSLGALKIHSLEGLIQRFRNQSAPGAEVFPEDEAYIQFTGAIAEPPRGVVLTHANLVANTLQIASWVVRARKGQEVFVGVLPLFHVYGMAVAMNVPIYLASSIILFDRFDASLALWAIEKYQATCFAGVPPMFASLLQAPEAQRDRLSSLRVCWSGGAPLALEILEDFEKLVGVRISEGYGLAEASPATHCNPIFGKRKPGSVGLPYPDTLAKIVDLDRGEKILPPGAVGELCIRGPQVMKGYWKQPELTARTIRDGWLYTGDIGRMDEEGYFYILDVKKDMIIAGGFNIYPPDIDQVLAEHPKVAEGVAVGIPDLHRGETVKAFVVLKEGEKATEEEIIAFCRSHLARYKVPASVEFRDHLPKTPSGKILRRILREEERNRRMARRESELRGNDR